MSLSIYNIDFQITDVKLNVSVILRSIIWKPMLLSTYNIGFQIIDVKTELF